MIKEIVERKELYNFDQLQEMSSGNMDFIRSLALIFIKVAAEDSAAMVKAAKSGDWLTVSKMAHKLKSTVDGMNIFSIKKDIRTLEMDAKHKTNTSALPQLAQKVDRVIHEVAKQVRREFGF